MAATSSFQRIEVSTSNWETNPCTAPAVRQCPRVGDSSTRESEQGLSDADTTSMKDNQMTTPPMSVRDLHKTYRSGGTTFSSTPPCRYPTSNPGEPEA